MAENNKEPNNEPKNTTTCFGSIILSIAGLIFIAIALEDISRNGLFAIASAICFLGLKRL